MINPEAMDPEAFYTWFVTAPTQADVEAWVKPTPVDLAASWKAAHPLATCSDVIARGLAEIEAAR